MTCLSKVICFVLGLFCMTLLSGPAMASDIPISTDTEIKHAEDTGGEGIRIFDIFPRKDGTRSRARNEIRLIMQSPVSVRERIADGNYPDHYGMIGSNRGGWVCAAFQRGGMLRLMLSAVNGDEWAVTDSWRAIDAAFRYQNPDGSFQIGGGIYADYLDRLNDVSFWLAKLSHAILILQASDLGPAFESRIQALLPKIELSALYLADGVDVLSHGDRDAPNRLFFHAGALGFSGALIDNQQLIELGRRLAAEGMALQRADGAYLELGGHDSGYQGVSLLQFQQYTFHFPGAAADASLLLGAQWEETRILPNGQVDTTGNTRTGVWGKQVAYIEVMMGLLYAGGAQDYYPAVDAGLRCYSYFYHVPVPTMDIADHTDIDGERFDPSILLDQNYPNPFRETTNISYTLTSGQNVRMAIYNTLGQRVRTLADGYCRRGNSQVTWDSRDDAGNQVSPGVYVIRLETPFASETRKLSLVE
ncbi:MAG: FlgD immunoglobulin-like domain containing protein [Candidatus Eisenbacteria bacterium]